MNPGKTILIAAVLALCPLSQARAQLLTPRHSHTTTLLPDGNFLVAGGVTGSGNTPTALAEIYITSKTVFEAISPLPVARSSHTATVLGDGRVLIAGGFNNGGTPLNTAFLFDNRDNSWSAAYTMKSARGGHTATLINKGPNAGNALICGGQTAADYKAAGGITDTCEIFNTKATASPYFTWAASLAAARMNHAAAALSSGNIFISGGMQWDSAASTFTYLADNEVYDAGNNTWGPVTALLQGRAYHTITTINNGDIMITGGYNGANFFNLNTEEKWYYDGIVAGDAGIIAQDAGSHGYLDAAEFFDPNGGRVAVNGAIYSVMPYRTMSHAAALSTDGRVELNRGYGNMVPTFFNASPTCLDGSHLHLTPVTPTGNTVTINNTSVINFPLDIKLSTHTPVSGRVANGDIFFSLPESAGDPSLTVDAFKGYLPRSTAPLDGLPIGRVTGPGVNAGEFKTDVTLQNPGGTGVFATETIVIQNPIATMSDIYFNAVSPGASGPLNPPSSATISVTFSVPLSYYNPDSPYSHLRGQAAITGGTITDDDGFYSISLTGGTGTLPSTLIGYDAFSNLGSVTVSIPFAGLTGTITNSTSTVVNAADIIGDVISGLSIALTYTSDYVSLFDDTTQTGAAYSVDTSSFVVREMIFSTNLGFKPSDFTWDITEGNAYDSELPIFNHTRMITPAGDDLMIGGRNCEIPPNTDCRRGTKKFTASDMQYVIVTVPDKSKNGGWPDEKPLKENRAYHTSTLMPDGSILTCGGSDGARTSDTCELYLTTSTEWNYTGSMTSKRSRHTATLLPNGTVLAAGGTTGASTSAVSTAEIYYPDTKRWVPTQSMAVPRQNHTATLLPDGNVLVAGGSSDIGYSSAAAVFISTAAAWQTAGYMKAARSQHTATLLKNGNVLVTGGINGPALLTTEIYNSLTRSWTDLPASPSMNTARYSHTATLLKDGRVLVTGGSDGGGPRITTELYNGVSWSQIAGRNMAYERANHKATLLTNGKILLTGGETLGATRPEADLYTTDFDFWVKYGDTYSRQNHTAVLALNGNVYIMGGWDGTKYLNSVQSIYLAGGTPDIYGMEPKNRNPQVSTAAWDSAAGKWGFVDYLDRGQPMTLLSGATNFHGITEASGGGAGSANSSFHNPRVYLQAMDAPSGFLMDLTTGVYTLFGGPNLSWANTISSITVALPLSTATIPYGYYYARTEANGQYSNGRVVQVTIPRPTGLAVNISTSAVGMNSITWTWNQGTIAGTVDGYALFSSSNNLFIATATYDSSASYIQTGLAPNTAASIGIGAYNFGGYGPLSRSGTYYTYAAAPSSLTVTEASFETAKLTWNSSGNSAQTPYELSAYRQSGDAPPETPFTYSANISTPIPFSVNYLSTSAAITTLSPNQKYYFRVRAMNGAFIPTGFSALASTMTVGNISNLQGSARTMSEIYWSWAASVGADAYSLYAVTAGTETAVLVSSSISGNSYTQVNLSTNTAYKVCVRAEKHVTSPDGWLEGPFSCSGNVYTLAVPPQGSGFNTFTSISTGSLTVNWTTNGNSSSTVYQVNLSTNSSFAAASTTTVTGCTVFCAVAYADLKPNYRYYARVTAYNGDNIAVAPLDLGSRYTGAQSPSNVRATLISMSGVTISWGAEDNSLETIYKLTGSTDSFVSTLTYVSFGYMSSSIPNKFTGNTYPVNGLLTQTAYDFKVTARNGDPRNSDAQNIALGGLKETDDSGNVKALTLPGPDNAPSGSIGGVSDPAKDTVIHGFLPTGREITVSVPAAAFAQATQIAISSFSSTFAAARGTDLCHWLVGGKPIELEIFTQGNAQPLAPVTITLTYFPAESSPSDGIDANRDRLVIGRYNPVTRQCLPLETTINTGPRSITATLDHFSTFQLMLSTAAPDLSNVRVYPNPIYVNRQPPVVHIINIPAFAKIRIYTLSGDKIWEGSAGATGNMDWPVANKSGARSASGIYLAVIDSSAGKKVVKIAVER